jgi:hypothetical protein
MKKISLVLFLCFALFLCSCNENIGFGKFYFGKIHCTTTNECYELKSWRNNEMGIEVQTKEYGALYFSEGTYILVENKCPICDKN